MRCLPVVCVAGLVLLAGAGCSPSGEDQDGVHRPKVQDAGPSSWFQTATLDAYWGSPKSPTIVLLLASSRGAYGGRLEVKESSTRVEVGYRVSTANAELMPAQFTVSFRLREPLGERVLTDLKGRRIDRGHKKPGKDAPALIPAEIVRR